MTRIMNFPMNPIAKLVFVSLFLCHCIEAALDCNVQVSRSDAPAVCAHFEGINADPYYQWYDELDMQTRYKGMVYLQGSDASKPENGAAVHWNVEDEHLHLAIAVRATGWLGFGIGEAGGMLGADMVLFETLKPDQIVDAYTTDTRFPIPDDCPSDWDLVSFHINEEVGLMMVEFKRRLHTDDPQDKSIFNDLSTLVPPHRIIAAWSDSAEVGYHGLNCARGAIRFYGTEDDASTFMDDMNAKAEGSFLVTSIEHEIPPIETQYFKTCVTRDDLIDQGVLNMTDLLNIIGFEPVIQESHEAYVHHYTMYGYPTPECPTKMGMQELVYVWAPGEGPVSLPDYLGTPLFGEDGFQSFEIEVHYNNPGLIEGIIDSSGVRVYWTSHSRDQQVGILSLGDPIIRLMGQSVGDGLSMHSFECPGSCSALLGQSVTVLREYLHMHEIGARMTNEQIRNGKIIRQAAIDFWEFDQNGNAAIQQDPYVVEPGDGFKTSCYYNGDGRVFGIASSEEMCMAFLYYYPRLKIPVEEMNLEMSWMCAYQFGFAPCDSTHDSKNLTSIEDFDRSFGTSSEQLCDESDAPVEDSNSSSSHRSFQMRLALVAFLVLMF